MTSSYQNIYSRFLNKIRDYEFAGLPEPNATEQMLEWLQSALSKPYIYRIFELNTLEADDEIGQLTYTLTNSVNDTLDQNFVNELLAYQMIVEWLESKMNTTTLINQMVTNSKEQKFYNQKDHHAEIRNSYDDAENKVRSMLRDRGYIWNSYLGNANG